MHRRIIRTGLLGLVVTLAVASAGAPAAAADTRTCYSTDFSCIAGTGFTGQSVWGSWGPGHNCVSYAAYRLLLNGSAKPWGGTIGDGSEWDDKARAAGISVDQNPVVGSIAQWDGGSGHVAYVEVVAPTYIEISEDSYLSDTSGYSSVRRLDRAGATYAVAEFIHIRDTRDQYFIKTRNTGSGRVEIHTATPGSGYQGSDLHTTTWFGTGDQSNGWFQMVGRDLYFIKTKNTGSGRVEIHTATSASGYQGSDVHSTTWFGTGDQDNGWFQMVGRDLYFIKTKNTGSGRVEIHSATASSGYQGSSLHTTTWFGTGDQSNGWFQMVGRDLYFIKTKNTGSGRVEIHTATSASGYQGSDLHTTTWLGTGDEGNGWFQMVGRDLYFIKTKNTGSGRVEIHTANAGSSYQGSSLQTTTWFGTGDQDNGWFQIAGAKA